MAIRQQIRMCTARDGVRLAYAVTGGGTPLVKVGNWLTHLEFDLQSPVWGYLIEALSQDHQLWRYDQRGTGLSDWDVDRYDFDDQVSDLACVIVGTRLGPQRPVVAAVLHHAIHSRRHARAARLVQRAAAHLHLAGQCGAHADSTTVQGNLAGVSLMLRAMHEMVKPDLHALFSLHARARGGLVEHPAEAATRFGIDRGATVTPLDGEQIRAEFL
jgi:pimeloyl-ACP methyl ester carboxylesterase